VRRAFAIAFVATFAVSAVPTASAITEQLGVSSPEIQLGTGAHGKSVSDTEIPVRTAGELSVAFHGDPATGCATRGLCGYSGTVVWQPPRTGDLSIETTRYRGKLEYDAELLLTDQSDPLGSSPVGVTTANVRFRPDSGGAGSDCTDAAATGSDFSMPIHGRTAVASLKPALPDVLRTRCAGPLDVDLGRLDVGGSIAVSALLRGRRTIALGSSGAFAGHGFAGTATSTVALVLGKPITQRPPKTGPSKRAIPIRTVEVDYRASLTGRLSLQTHGDPGSCAPLGSCGANGAFSIRSDASGGMVQLVAVTRPSRPLRDVLTAFGLSTGGNPHGITAFGSSAGGSGGLSDVTVTQGSNTCRDSGPGAPAAMILTVGRGVLSVSDISEGPAVDLRCPGPLLASGTTVATARAPASILGHPPATIRLRGGNALNDDGYAGRSLSDLTLTLSHPRVKTHVQSFVIG
jgi:hypothetical protein